ncbi:MAG: PIN domain-containing protein [Candidatus Delongbacteria bacterium]|nr:PIN domain-containing protein [Candidatus Delongbacteria bacterium]MCG2759794.1 PIN domain-containing protein [Candidatus Delongbacteria bacterium]
MKYLFDTNAVINFISGKGDFTFMTSEDSFQMSFITAIELSVGCKNRNEDEIITKFKNRSDLVLIDRDLINKTVEIRKNYGLKIPDSIIAATALSENAFLVTSDKDFINRMNDSGLKILTPC